MEPKINEIACCDALEMLKALKEGVVNTIICDPPYFTGMTHNTKEQPALADLAICAPFYRELFRQFNRVLTPDGCVYWFCDWRSQGFYLSVMQECLPVRNMLVWDKGAGCGNFYTYEHELILFATKNTRFHCKGARGIIRGIPSFASGARKSDGDMAHPAQKPVALISRLITDSTSEGGTVLDCFMGSGTTAVAARLTGRNFYGCELQQKYVDVALNRLAKTDVEHSPDISAMKCVQAKDSINRALYTAT